MQYIYIRCQDSSRNEGFVNVLRWGDDNRAEIFNIAKKMTAKNQEVVGEKCKKMTRKFWLLVITAIGLERAVP